MFFCFCLAIPALAQEQQPKPLTWIECVVIAQKIHPQIRAAEERLQQSREDKALAASGQYPQISAAAGSSISKTEGASRTRSNSAAVSGRQLLFDASQKSHEVKAALETVKASQYNLSVVSSDVRRNLRAAFVQLLRSQELVGLTGQIAQRRSDNLKLVNMRYEAGREHKGSLLSAQADLAQAQAEVSSAKRGLTLAQVRLNKELGAGSDQAVAVAGDFVLHVDLDEEPQMKKLAEENPLLQELAAKKEAARWDSKAQLSAYYPQVYADAALGKRDTVFVPKTGYWSAGLSVSLPLFEGGSRKAQVKKSESFLRQTEQELLSGKDSVILTLQDTWTTLADARDTVFVQEKYLEAALERSTIGQAQYSNGLISFNEWTIIENNLVDARTAYLNAQANALIAEADWVQAKGGTLVYEE